MNKKRIGFIAQEECPATFDSFKGYFVNRENPNFPSSSDSPNYPRAEGRVPGFQNPILGDSGRGEIARWHKVRTNALHSLVDQMIEQYTRDRRWYSTVRCREALWNMYRRLAWWVNQNIEPGNVDYQNALSFIRDCIVQILDPGERPKVLYQHKFKDGMDDSFEYNGGWRINEYGNLSGDYSLSELIEGEAEKWTVSKTVDYPNDGLVTFSYALYGYAKSFVLKMDTDVIWEHDSTNLVDHSAYNFRDITLNVPKGVHKFTWEFIGETEDTLVNIDEIVFTELMPEIEKPKELPSCPLPYNHHFASDYMNYFTGVPYERPTFSTVGGSKVSDFLDMIRYVSSKENIEWEQIKNINGEDWSETIFKLPLERLPETLSSKMTFNWRLKRKGYITFKYWVDGGNGSELLFYINNQLVGGPWKDTNGWKVAKFNMSQSQTYKFDILVHKSVSKNLGTNAIYIKDIEVVEVTDYTDEPMPGDYTLDGEEAETEYGKWLIYSHEGALGTYYRGFPDGAEDMTREIELEFYSECEGVFGFGYRVGTKDPDRLNVEGLVFSELHGLDDHLVIWDGEENGVGIPTISVKPVYNNWSNDIPDEYSFIDESVLWTKENTSINYKISIDGEWDKGEKLLNSFGSLGVICPPKYIAQEGYKLSNNQGYWSTIGAWGSERNEVRMEGYSDEDYGNAIYNIGDKNTAFVSTVIEENMLQGERLNIYLDDYLYFSSLSGFSDLKLNIPILGDKKVRFEVEKEPEPEKEIVFTGYFDFDGRYTPLESDTLFEVAKSPLQVNRQYSDNRGRELEIEVPTGGLESAESWYTSEGFKINLTMLPGDEVNIRIPNTRIPYVDLETLEELVNELIAEREIKEPIEYFYEDFNPFKNTDKVSSDEGWGVVDIFKYLDIRDGGDNVILCEGNGEEHYMDINLKGLDDSEGELILNFEYGGLFVAEDNLELFVLVDSKYERIRGFNVSSLKPNGISVKGIRLPANTEGLRFVYHS